MKKGGGATETYGSTRTHYPDPNQTVFAVTSKWCVFGGEAAKTNLIYFGLTHPGIKPTIYRTRGGVRLPLHSRCGLFLHEMDYIYTQNRKYYIQIVNVVRFWPLYVLYSLFFLLEIKLIVLYWKGPIKC